MDQHSKIRLSANLKRMRRAKGVTQAALEELAGLPAGAISTIERGKRQIDMEMLNRLCLKMDWPPEELLWGVSIDAEP